MPPHGESLAPFSCYLQHTPYFKEPYMHVDTPAHVSTFCPHPLQISNPRPLLGPRGTTILKKINEQDNLYQFQKHKY